MYLGKVVWAICLLLERCDTEGLGIFTLSNPLNKEAADQFLRDEDGFIKKAQEYTARYATLEYHKAMKNWHGFYPNFEEVYDPDSATEKLGRQSSIDKRLPKTTLQETEEQQSDEQVAEQLFGGNDGALVELYTPQLQRLSALLGCCSAEACGASRDPNRAVSHRCTLACNGCRVPASSRRR